VKTIALINLIFASTALCSALAAFSVSWSYTKFVLLLGRGISTSQGRYLHTEQHKRDKSTQDIHASSGIRIHDPGVRPGEDVHAFFLILDSEAIGIAATPGLFCQPQVIVKMIVEKQMECRLAGETEVLGENLPQGHFCPSQKNPTWPDPGLTPGRRGGKPATNRLSYGAAQFMP
jgi:hypothetical protein